MKHQEVAHDWQLAPLKLPVGTVITFHAEALDFDRQKGPNLGKSREIRLRIISKEDATRQFDDSRRELREELARVLTMQKQAITPVENAIRSLKETPALPQVAARRPEQRRHDPAAGRQPLEQPRRRSGRAVAAHRSKISRTSSSTTLMPRSRWRTCSPG